MVEDYFLKHFHEINIMNLLAACSDVSENLPRFDVSKGGNSFIFCASRGEELILPTAGRLRTAFGGLNMYFVFYPSQLIQIGIFTFINFLYTIA